jgi:hypothetical protein
MSCELRGITWHLDAAFDKAVFTWLLFHYLFTYKASDMKKAYLGIDVSKGYADFMLIDSDRRPLSKDFKLSDTRSGHDKLQG